MSALLTSWKNSIKCLPLEWVLKQSQSQNLYRKSNHENLAIRQSPP